MTEKRCPYENTLLTSTILKDGSEAFYCESCGRVGVTQSELFKYDKLGWFKAKIFGKKTYNNDLVKNGEKKYE